jgi:hypothetical protein
LGLFSSPLVAAPLDEVAVGGPVPGAVVIVTVMATEDGPAIIFFLDGRSLSFSFSSPEVAAEVEALAILFVLVLLRLLLLVF